MTLVLQNSKHMANANHVYILRCFDMSQLALELERRMAQYRMHFEKEGGRDHTS